ncbi:MAG: hypothetical protein ACI9R3_003644 [Verrucomicrobiales bacterium]|jgi:hypothetical protein
MARKSSFLPGLHRVLFGRPPVSAVEKISRQRGEIDEVCLSQLPVRLLLEVHAFVVSRLQSGVQGTGPRTLVVDGSTASMPDTPKNQKKYPQHTQKPGCGFPIMKLVGPFCLEGGAWIATAKCHMKIHEPRLFQRLFRHLRKGDTLLADRAYCSYWNVAKLSSKTKGVDFVMRNHQRRIVDFRKGKRLGKRDHCVIWSKPKRRGPRDGQGGYDASPDHLVVRETQLKAQRKGYRTGVIVVVSSFINPEEKTIDELGEYFLRRWKVELYFGDIKTSQAMDVFHTMSPNLICRELLMHMIAYNLTRAVALQSTANTTTPLAAVSGSVSKGQQTGSWYGHERE